MASRTSMTERSSLDLFWSIKEDEALWVNLTDEDLHAAIDIAFGRGDTRTVGKITYEIATRANRAREAELLADLRCARQEAKALWEDAEIVRGFWGIEDEDGYHDAQQELATTLDVLRDSYGPEAR